MFALSDVVSQALIAAVLGVALAVVKVWSEHLTRQAVKEAAATAEKKAEEVKQVLAESAVEAAKKAEDIKQALVVAAKLLAKQTNGGAQEGHDD